MLFAPLKVSQDAMGARVFSPKLLHYSHRACRRGARRWRMFAIDHLQEGFAGGHQESMGRELGKGRRRQQRENKIKAEWPGPQDHRAAGE